MHTLVLRDIGELLTMAGPSPLPAARGADDRTAVAAAEAALGVVRDATLVLVNGRVHYAGPATTAPRELPVAGSVVVRSAQWAIRFGKAAWRCSRNAGNCAA